MEFNQILDKFKFVVFEREQLSEEELEDLL